MRELGERKLNIFMRAWLKKKNLEPKQTTYSKVYLIILARLSIFILGPSLS